MQDLTWWQRAVIYEIYSRSFQDSNGDGIGDLNGILERLDYLVDLGVDAIWLSPIYPSPMADFGYDISDYCAVNGIFGSMEDFDRLLAEVHRRGMKLILDYVPNHTSSQHPWFLESRSSRDSPKRNWYLWRDEPNNWLSNFGGSGWEWDQITGQYYYHSFLKEQPDLNWRHPGVRSAMFDVLQFWLDRGVDGFRVDVMWLMIKDEEFRDNPPNPGFTPDQPSNRRLLPFYNSNRPEVHELVAEMRAFVDRYPNRVLIGEIYLPIQQLMAYYGKDLKGANLPFNFQLLQSAWKADAIAETISQYHGALPAGAWPNWVLGNHDNPRIATRVGFTEAPLAAMLLLTLPGTLTVYYGEELAMTDVSIPFDEILDPAEKNEPALGLGRDPERTPMQWDGSAGAGFTTGRPWLPPASDYAVVNAAAMDNNPASILHLYRRLIALRRSHPALVSGKMHSVSADNNLLRYERVGSGESLLVLLNMGHAPVHAIADAGTIIGATALKREGQKVEGRPLELDSGEGLLIKLDD